MKPYQESLSIISGLVIVDRFIQLAFGSGNEGRCGSSTDDVGCGTGHICDAGNRRKQDDSLDRQAGSGEQSRCGDGRSTGNTDGADGDDDGQNDEEGVLHGSVINAQQVDGKDSQQGGPDTSAARHTEVCAKACAEGSDILVDAQLLGQLVDVDRDGADAALRCP